MDKILIGKYVSTHGIKGEIRIKSNFKYKDRVFKKGNIILINNQEFIITNYRVHKEYDMLSLNGINNINQILNLKGSLVYIYKDLLNLGEFDYLDSDLINLEVYMSDKLIGKVENITYINDTKKLLIVNNNYIPFELVKELNIKNKRIEIEEVDGLV